MHTQAYSQWPVLPGPNLTHHHASDLTLKNDPWCRGPSFPHWTGVDFSRCARLRYLIGLPALVLLSLLILSFVVPLLPRIWKNFLNSNALWLFKSTQFNPPTNRRPPPVALKHPDLNGPQAVSRAEDQIIAAEVMQEGGLGIDQRHRKELLEESNPPPTVPSHTNDFAVERSYATALIRSWKDLTITAGTIGLALIAVARCSIEIPDSDPGSNWLWIPPLLWFSVSLLSIAKLLIHIKSSSHNQSHPGPTYCQLEFRILPVYLCLLPCEILDVRSTLLKYFNDQPTPWKTKQLAVIGLLNLAISFFIIVLALFTSRPTTLLPANPKESRVTVSPPPDAESKEERPPPLEPGRSLISLAYFMHTDSYLWRHIFKTASEESIPDLRADDKSAAVLFRWKRDQAQYQAANIKPSLLRLLVWHFRAQLLGQQIFAYMNAVGALLPPFFLQRILSYLSSKSGENPEPMHVALLYALGMLFTQIFLAFSQSTSLMLGRRLSVRMRALLISLIFTKSLRRTGISPQSPEGLNLADDCSSPSKSAPKEDQNASASTGKITNLVSNDVFSLAEIGAYLHFIWPESSIQLLLSGIYLYVLLGYSALAGIFCAVIAIPIQSYLTTLWAKNQDKLMAAADRRLGLASEVINNIKVVKFFAWESNFLNKMEVLREAELNLLFKRFLVTIAESTVSLSVPISVSIVTFYVHTKILGKPLTAEEAFTALALFNLFRNPLSILVGMISGLVQSYVSLKRIEKFLNEKETEKYSTLSVPRPEVGDPSVGFKNASFAYDTTLEAHNNPTVASPAVFKLSGLDFTFPEGKLSLIVGRVGSGKGTLLLSLLGEVTKIGGEAFLPSPISREWNLDPDHGLTDTTAYCPQQAWLLSDSIRNNILYGSKMNHTRYTRVLQACALGPDLATFTDGDLTEIGDKGTVLSGGQKARISLARALYSPAKVLLLDDVLSAVDSHTAQHLYKHVLTGPLMKDRTCILVTHAVELCMPAAEFIVSLDRGEVVYAGDPATSSLAPVLPTSDETGTLNKHDHDKTGVEPNIESLAEPALNDEDTSIQIKIQATQRLVEQERQAVGAVSSTIYRLYYDSLGGLASVATSLLLFVLAELANVLSTWILEEWAGSNQKNSHSTSFLSPRSGLKSIPLQSTQPSPPAPDVLSLHAHSSLGQARPMEERLDHYILLYLLTGILALAFEISRLTFFTCRSIVAARKIYQRLISTLLHAKVRFFDTVPMGRVLNRLSKDVQTMDRDLAEVLVFFTDDILASLAILVVLIAVLPLGFLFATLGACLIYVAIGHIYLSSTREIKRSESTSRSPVMSLCAECLGGVTSIRAYGDIGRYTQQMFRLIDAYNRPFFMLWMCNRWLSSRIDVAAAILTFLVVLYMIQSDMPAALSGFAMSYVITFNTKTSILMAECFIRLSQKLERIHEYLGIEQEPKAGIQPPAAWPSKQGTIEVEGLTARYAPHLPPVLKSVSFSVKAGQKIGICGRTGSGKSTLALSFFRFIEAEAGRILIDGLDISKLDLCSLRSRLTIIPQESVLFSATIRWNLDPFSEHEDSQIWDALRRVGMAAPSPQVTQNQGAATDDSTAKRSTSGDLAFIASLDMEVQDGGKNFSSGQRQLLAIARAILKLENSALLILDESTASLDAESDEKIQATIRTEMRNSTILCIAHRLKTIIDYDKVLVLSDGEVLEFEEPWKLLLDDNDDNNNNDDDDDDGSKSKTTQTQSSCFKQLCKKSGHFDQLKKLALEAKKT